MKNNELKSLVKNVEFGRVADRFKQKTSVCSMTLTDGYRKNFKLDDDTAYLVKLLSENGVNPIKEWDIRNELSKEGNEYVGLFIILIDDTQLQYLVEKSTLKIMEVLNKRVTPKVVK